MRDGEIHHLSASSLNTADCLRRWWFRYVLRLRPPETKSQAVGKAVHASIDHYYATGEEAFHPLAMHARPFIPDRTGVMQWSEHELSDFWILPGIRFVGAIDLYHFAGSYKLPNGELERNSTGMAEIIDWKTSSDPTKWAMQEHEFIATNQMPAYARYHFNRYPAHDLVRVSHVYMRTRGAPLSLKTTAVLDRDAVFHRWDEMTSVARILRDVARETVQHKVPVNEDLCGQFGGCPYQDKCEKPAKTLTQSLDAVFGITKADTLRGRQTTMVNVDDEIEKLKQEQAAAQSHSPEQDVRADWEIIIAADMGTPALAADAAQALAKAMGWDEPKGGYAGCGDAAKGHKLQTLPPLNLQALHTVAENLRKAKASIEVPEPAPAPEPAPQVHQAEGHGVPVQAQEQSEAWGKPEVDLSVYKDVKSGRAYPEDQDENLEEVMRLIKDGKSSKIRKPQAIAAVKALMEAYARDCADTPASDPIDDTDAYERGYTDGMNSVQADNMHDQGYVLYIDCIPSGPYDLLDEYIARALAEICKQFGERDIRAAHHEDLNYGRWKGILSTYVRECPPPDGQYTITTGDEINKVVAAELARGASRYVRGIR